MVGAATNLFEQLFEKSEIPRCSTTTDDLIINANSKFRTLFDLKVSEILKGDIKLQEVISAKCQDNKLEKLTEELGRFIERKGSADIKLSIINSQGQKTKLDFHRKLIKTEAAAFISYEFIDVTEKIEYRKNVRSATERLEIAAEVSNLGVWEYEFESKQWYLNDAMLDLFGIPKFNGGPEDFNQVIDKNDLSFLYDAWKNAKENSEPLNINIRVTHPKKGRRNLQISGKTLRRSDKTLWRFVGTVSDITKQKLREDDVIRDRERLRSLVDSQSSFIIRINEKGIITFCNQSFREAFSKDLNYTEKHSLGEFLNPNDFNSVLRVVNLCKENPGRIYTLLSGDQQDKSSLNIDWEFTAITINNGKQIEIQGLGRDISDRVALLAKVEDAYGKINSLINNFSSVSIWSVDTEYRLTASNDFFIEQFSLFNLQKINLGDVILNKLHPENTIDWKSYYDRALKEGSFELVIDLSDFVFQVSFNPIFHLGKTNGVAVYGRDITNSTKAERALKSSEERLQFAIESNKYAVWELELPQGTINFSDAFYNLLGYNPSEFKYDVNLFNNIIHPNDLKSVMQTYGGITSGEHENFESEFRMKNSKDEYIWFHNRGRIFEKDIQGNPKRVIGIINNINERKKAESQIGEYLEKLEKFAHLTSHSLRKPVANIIGLSSVMQEELNVSDTLKDYLIEIKRSSSQLDLVIKEMTEAISFGSGNPTLKKHSNLQIVWFIDDDEINNMLSERMMKRVMPEANVKSFLSAEEALEILKNKNGNIPDAIFLDINMPTMNGWEFLDSLAVLNMNLNIYMLTSSIDSRDQDKANKYTQVNDFISKPLREERLRLLID